MVRNDGTSTATRAHDRGLLVEYILGEQKGRKKPPTWEHLASAILDDPSNIDYAQCLLQDQRVPEHVRTWPTSSEMCRAGGESSDPVERPDESSEGDEETAGIDSGATNKNAGEEDDHPVAERVESDPVLDAIIVFINHMFGGEKASESTLQLQLVSLDLCVACRRLPSLTLRVGNKALRYLQADQNTSSRVPTLQPAMIRGKHAKEALLSKNHNLIDCRRVERLTFGKTFDMPIADIPWPHSLQLIEFGRHFNQPIVSVEWPRSLQKLTFGGLFNQPVEGISWPPDLRELDLGLSFNRPIENVAWPKSLRTLWVGPCFNQPIARVKWSTLVKLELGIDFNQPIAQVRWPESLRRLTFGYSFDREIEHVRWPIWLRELEFGDMFNKGIQNVSWPAGLKELTFGRRFDQPIERVMWPACLEGLIFGDDFSHPIEDTEWPASLKKFTLGLKFEQPIANVSWPQAFEHLHIENTSYDLSIDSVLWLPSLKYVTMGEETVFKSIFAIRQESGSDSEASWGTMAAGDNLSG